MPVPTSDEEGWKSESEKSLTTLSHRRCYVRSLRTSTRRIRAHQWRETCRAHCRAQLDSLTPTSPELDCGPECAGSGPSCTCEGWLETRKAHGKSSLHEGERIRLSPSHLWLLRQSSRRTCALGGPADRTASSTGDGSTPSWASTRRPSPRSRSSASGPRTPVCTTPSSRRARPTSTLSTTVASSRTRTSSRRARRCSRRSRRRTTTSPRR